MSPHDASPPRTLVVYAHPRPNSAVATRALREVLQAAPDTELRMLYDLYPDFDIDVAAEQQALSAASLVVWLAPVYWYSVPALLKHWFDEVLAYGWAFGPGGAALRGKTAWWVASAGGAQEDYAEGQPHQRPFGAFVAPIEQTARFCGMHWLPPHVEHGGHDQTSAELAQCSRSLSRVLAQHRNTLFGAPASEGHA